MIIFATFLVVILVCCELGYFLGKSETIRLQNEILDLEEKIKDLKWCALDWKNYRSDPPKESGDYFVKVEKKDHTYIIDYVYFDGYDWDKYYLGYNQKHGFINVFEWAFMPDC